MEPFAILLPAAGSSTRYGGGRAKLLEPLAGEPVLRHAARAFLIRRDVESLVIAAPQDDVSILIEALGPLGSDPRIRFCRGGAMRADSVRNALRNVPEHIKWVAVHDAARPLTSQALIDRTFAAARQYGAAVPAMPAALTIKQADGPLPA